VPLTFFVLNEAIRQCRTWQLEGVDLSVGVNLSARNLLDVHLPDTVGELLGRWEVPPSLLELEITESTILADPIRAMHVLSRLSGMGVRLAIDDFGTGYSSLAYLKRLPVDELKIDKSFVDDLMASRSGASLAEVVVTLAATLGMRTVAEGVEAREQAVLLRGMGCAEAQGFLFHRPMPPDDVEAVLRTRSAAAARPSLVAPTSR
jgi:EAL domain-containing protein (putative c-di-GMP-specific phosphodiesterase class I)